MRGTGTTQPAADQDSTRNQMESEMESQREKRAQGTLPGENGKAAGS